MRQRRTARTGVSARAGNRLAAELAEELARTRTAWEAATLRGDAALQGGDRAAAVRALAEQRALLHDLQRQVDTVVGRALVEREAETIVATEAAQSARSGSRGGTRAAVGAVIAAMIGLVAIGATTPVPAPDVAPLAGATDDRVAVAADRIRPTEVAFDRVADVLTDLRSVFRSGRGDGRAAPDPGPHRAHEPSDTTTPREDGTTDAEPSDTQPSDAGPSDAGPSDAGPSDAEPSDAEPSDAGPSDAGPSDAGPSGADPVTDDADAVPDVAGPSEPPSMSTVPIDGLLGHLSRGQPAGER